MQKVNGILDGLIVMPRLNVNSTPCRERWNRWYDFEIYGMNFLSQDLK